MLRSLLGKKKNDSKVKNTGIKASNESMFSSMPNKKEENIFDIANTLNDAPNANIKGLRIAAIKKVIERASLVELINYMKSEVDIVRSIAAEVFSNNPSPNIYNCIEKMLDDTNENLRISCTEALCHLMNEESINIIEKSTKDQSAKVRLQSAICLADLATTYGNKNAVELLNSLITDPDSEVREFVIDEIGLIGNSNSAKQLLNIVDDEKYQEEKELISESLNLILSKAFA